MVRREDALKVYPWFKEATAGLRVVCEGNTPTRRQAEALTWLDGFARLVVPPPPDPEPELEPEPDPEPEPPAEPAQVVTVRSDGWEEK